MSLREKKKSREMEDLYRFENAHLQATSEDQGGQTSGEFGGRYVYGIACWWQRASLGPIGLEKEEVYTIPYRDICAVVHNCLRQPYQSDDDEKVKNWLSVHQGVLDQAKERFGIIIPLTFDTIVEPKDEGSSVDETVRDWLKEDYDRLKGLFQDLRGKDEYGVQVFYQPSVITKWLTEQSEEIRRIQNEMQGKSPGMAYMYKQKLESALKAETKRFVDRCFKDFHDRIQKHAHAIVMEKTKRQDKDSVMLLNLSCLVAEEKVKALGEELERINAANGISVRFTGPWPPYSFLTKQATQGE